MDQTIKNFEILLGISGGIAAYKAAALCSQLAQRGVGVNVILTEHATHFISPLTLSTLSGRQVYSSLWEAEKVYEAQHISLTAAADLIVVAPATANILAKVAAGICDDLLSTLLIAAESPVLLAPAMNPRMWEHPATQRNVATLREWGLRFIGPDEGRMACGDLGLGRMSEPEVILAKIIELLAGKTPKKGA